MIERWRFRSAGSVGMAALAGVVMMVIFGGVALPLHLGTIGSFRLATNQVTATGVQLEGALDLDSATNDTAAVGDGAIPVAKVTLGTMTALRALILEKTFNFTPIVAGLGTWKLRIDTFNAAAVVTGSNVVILSPHICMNTMTMTTFGLDGRRAGTVDPTDDFLLTAATATFGDNTADAVEMEIGQLTATTLSIPTLRIRMLQGGYVATDYDCLDDP